MKIDRRCFLSLGIGAAAGTVLSPLPWKLTDDLSIWTQMWPWTPVPEHGEVSYVNTVSSLCQGGCGITVRKVDDRAVKIEGREGYPGNNGGVCVLCESGLQLLYGPTRVGRPMKRTGERGEGKWQPLSWEAAIQEVAAKIKDVRNAGAPEKLAWITGSNRGTVAALVERFATACGSPNVIRSASMEDGYRSVFRLMHGADGVPGFDVENADFVLSFGCGIIDGWGASTRMFQAKSRWVDQRVRLVQVEPRLSNTAAKSDQWIPIQPGTEGLLALAIAHVIIKESLYDYSFVNEAVSGFDRFRALVLDAYSPGQVSGATGIDAVTITGLAQEFARASRPIALFGRGQGLAAGSLGEYVAVHALNALVGNINRRGGVWAVPEMDYIRWPEPYLDPTAQGGIRKGRLDDAGPYADHLLHRLPKAIGEGAVEAVFVYGANPVYTTPDAAAMKAAFDQVPFIVSFATHMDETAAIADLVLPVHSNLERWEDLPAPSAHGKPMIGLARPVVAPQFDTLHPGDAVIRIAQAVGGAPANAFPWETYEDCLRQTLSDRWSILETKGYWVDEAFEPESWTTAFQGPAMRLELVSDVIEPATLFEPPSPEGDDAGYPLILLAYDTMRLSAGPIGTPPFMIKTVPDTVLKGMDSVVEVHPETAGNIGLAEGDRAELSTPKGKATVRVHLFEGILPGVVAMPRGLGHTAHDEYLAGKGVNVNELIGPVEDPTTGLDAAWGIRAALSRA
ncbi:MAG: menaquinone reductase molybdopterin-binding-like subunit QrcB [Desulfobacterales bacterium]